jgi:hypothetical protein
MEFEGSESHCWCWIIYGSDIWYAGTYGGVRDIKVKKFNKVEYSVRFIKAMKGSIADYSYIFQIEPAIYDVDFELVSYMKSGRY